MKPVSYPTPCRECGKLAFSGGAVTISAAEYSELLSRPQGTALVLPIRSKSVLARDPEVGDFVIECAARMMGYGPIKKAADERFGADRVPSMTSIHRFVQAVSKGKRPGLVRPRR